MRETLANTVLTVCSVLRKRLYFIYDLWSRDGRSPFICILPPGDGFYELLLLRKFYSLPHVIANSRLLLTRQPQFSQSNSVFMKQSQNSILCALSSWSSCFSDATPTLEFKSGAHHSQPRRGHAHLPLWSLRLRSRTSSYGPPFCVRPTLPKREKTISSPLRKIRPSQPDLRVRPHSPKIQVNITGERSYRE